jgi:carotenoid 1,2-hydratase
MNVALYGRGSAWALHERSVGEGVPTTDALAIGASRMAWVGDGLVIDLDERTTPFGRPVRGRIVVRPEAMTGAELVLDDRGAHRWWPVAPLARIEVQLTEPSLRFTGHGYHDANAGDTPMEAAFTHWAWSRSRTRETAVIAYDVACTSGTERSVVFRVGATGALEPIEGTHPARLPTTAWRISRFARADAGSGATLVRSLEDGPFYARALVEHRLGGVRAVAMHETLAATRVPRPWVRHLVRYRMRSGA